jgi:hypothetical protein
LRCCISKSYYMSLVRYIARLQRFYLLLARMVVHSTDEQASLMDLCRGAVSATLRTENGIHSIVKQIWQGTYLTDDLVSIWFNPCPSYGCSNWCLLGYYICKYHYCRTLHLIPLKVFPIFRTAYFLAW